MKVGDLVQWGWPLEADSWDPTFFTGIIVATRMAKTDYEKLRIFKVFGDDGTLLEVREDEPGLQKRL